ncbi:polyribonucleotide nucleotidyltransferase [Chlamydiia bacterium]|nr:polyribonucleotide nucleotidyltransferase [Chlamydiia bacterium]
MRELKSITINVGETPITFETGVIATQADASIIARLGETVVFSSCCTKATAESTGTFLPLRVDYMEKYSSCGKTLGGFLKREGRPSEHETLVCRLIDRPIRPNIANGFYDELQIINTVWSYDGSNKPDVLAICASGAAVALSSTPEKNVISAVRVGRVNGEFIINPKTEQLDMSDLNLVLAGSQSAIMMIEGECNLLTDEDLLEALRIGHDSIKTICAELIEWQKVEGKKKKTDRLFFNPSCIKKTIEINFSNAITDAINITDKDQRDNDLSKIGEQISTHFNESMENILSENSLTEGDITESAISAEYKDVKSDIMRAQVVSKKIRVDGRCLEDIRPISIIPDFLPRTHGSAVFTRGNTQTVAVATLGDEDIQQRYETLDNQDCKKRFNLLYTFPPYCVGEVGRFGAPSRREVGHGKLAERAILPVLPELSVFPYAMRLESNITESNGSSSMASVCGGITALMVAGVPIKEPVSGIAMGLILQDGSHYVLSDILGIEDALGDMDFKVTGTHDRVTAFQMDIKVEGITLEIMKEALAQARKGRQHILNIMTEACAEPRKELSPHAPRMEQITINTDKIGLVIGPGGKQIKSIIEQTGANVNISDDGVVNISGVDAKGVMKAKEIITLLVEEPEIGKTYDGRITSIMDFGMFVEIIPGKEGLCHISEIDWKRIEDMKKTDFKPNDKIQVKLLNIDDKGRLKLSRKALLKRPEKTFKEVKPTSK